jgi:hypothetical protein
MYYQVLSLKVVLDGMLCNFVFLNQRPLRHPLDDREEVADNHDTGKWEMLSFLGLCFHMK